MATILTMPKTTVCQLLQDKEAGYALRAKNTVAQNVDPEYILYDHPVCPKHIPFVLIILSGWGEGREDEYNAINQSNCLAIKTQRNIYPYRWRTLKAHGEWVGLPKNTDTGNGEAGNNTMGCGKIIIQR
jgi:2,3-bisphosphoglycerate-independent phosphoglycerate mutase